MPDRILGEVVVADPPGEVISRLMLRLSAEHRAMIRPRVTVEGTRMPLPSGLLRGAGELIVSAEEGGTRVRLVGRPPPWPMRVGWPQRILRRYLASGQLVWAN